jgi:hypothetical protein
MKTSRSTTVAILIMFAGYTIGSYGIVLLRDYNITWKQWINPLNPWRWSNPLNPIPKGQLWPGGAGSTSQTGGSDIPETTNYATGTIAGSNPVISNVAGRGR